MKLFIASDTHTDQITREQARARWLSMPREGVDAIVLAGDIATGFKRNLKKDLALLCDLYPEVILVLGNHDYWRSSIESKVEQVSNLANRLENLHFLQNTRKKIGEHYFAGTTLWFPEDPMATDAARWFDCRYVEGGYHKLVDEHTKAKDFLVQNVQEGDIVVTHHLPADALVHPRWRGDPMNKYFVGKCDDVIMGNRPAFWFFGHTHDFIHLTLADTEFYCNPFGYGYEDSGFKYEVFET